MKIVIKKHRDYKLISKVLTAQLLLSWPKGKKAARTDILEWSDACRELMDIYNTSISTNLAYMKKMTLKHHFELMHMLLTS